MQEYDDLQDISAYDTDMEPVLGVGQWLIITLVMSIPVVNIIMLFVWGFGNGSRTRANYCKASLIWWIIGMILIAILSAAVGSLAMMGGLPS